LHTFTLNGFVNQLGAGAVHGKHVEVDASDLRIEVGSYRATSGDVSLHDVAYDLDDLRILQTGGVLVRLRDDVVPLDCVSEARS
jgi:hypothetical protein